MKLHATLDPSSLMRLAEDLKDYAKRLEEEAAPEIESRLATAAAAEAAGHFSEGVAVTASGNRVIASGSEVVFQEFGAGARISDPYPGGADVGFDIRRGAYSDLHGGEYAQSGYELWHHGGEEYRFVTPGNGLFYGMERAREQAASVAKEVLKR